MPKSVTEIVTESHGESRRVTESHGESRRYDHSTGMELPMVWGNVKHVMDGVCDGVCDGVWLFGKDSFEECPLTLLKKLLRRIDTSYRWASW